MTRLLLVALFLPAFANAQDYDGVYKQNANAECSLIGADGGSLKIEDGIFYGVELECRMTSPVDVIDMDATLYTMICTGEDQAWTERAMLMKPAQIENPDDPDGLIMVWDGYAFVYEGCPS